MKEYTVDDEKDCNGNLKQFYPGDRVYVGPLKMEATVIEQLKSYDGPDYWFWGNVLLQYDDGIVGASNSWQLKKMGEKKKVSFEMTLFDDEKNKEKMDLLNCLETMFDDERNELPEEYFWFSDEMPLGTKIRVTYEVIE